MMRPGAVSGATRALRCLWHKVRVDERAVNYVTGNGRYVGQQPGTRVDSGSCSPQATCELHGTARRPTRRPLQGTKSI
eukprot:5530183-Prymnesium_polylepis.1